MPVKSPAVTAAVRPQHPRAVDLDGQPRVDRGDERGRPGEALAVTERHERAEHRALVVGPDVRHEDLLAAAQSYAVQHESALR